MYIITHFGKLTHIEQIEILKSFKGKDEDILISYGIPGFSGVSENEIKIIVEEEIEYSPEDYFSKTLYLYDGVKESIEKKIEEIVLNYISVNKDSKIDSFEKLMSDIDVGNLQAFDEKTIYDIKYAITYEMIENNYNKQEFEEIKKKSIFINHSMFDVDGRHDDLCEVLWYPIEYESDEDLWQEAFNCADNYFVIGNKSRSFDDYSYALVYMESAEDYNLIIFPSNDMDFEQIIKPRIEKINSNIDINMLDKNFIKITRGNIT